MSSDETLYSRQNSKEIDEALAWLESLGDSAATRRSASRQAEPTAFMRLPSWLRQDVRSELPEPPVAAPPVQTTPPPVQSDNLSWLDAITSGAGGISEEPPTMQWVESAIEPIPEDEATELLRPDAPDFNLDEPTHVSTQRPSVDDERTTTIFPDAQAGTPTQISGQRSSVDDELTTTIVPRSEEAVADEFEPTNIISDLSDDALMLIDENADLEPTELIPPEKSEKAFSFADLFDEPTQLVDDDLEPTNLITPEQESDESRPPLPPLPPIFEVIEPFEPTALIVEPEDEMFEPTSVIVPDRSVDEDAEPTQLVRLDEDAEPTQLVRLDEAVGANINEAQSAELVTEDDPPSFPDIEPTELYLPDSSELDALVEPATPPAEIISPEPISFEDIPTELIFDDFAAMAADVEQLTAPESTEIILPTSDELPEYDFPELRETAETTEPKEITDEENLAVEQTLPSLSEYIDEPTEPSLVRPILEDLIDEPTQFITADDKPLANLFEPTVVSEISIAERWQLIPTQFKPRQTESAFIEAEVEPVVEDEQPTETINEVLHIADEIPDDPDETIAWLEEMARQQKLGISAEKPPKKERNNTPSTTDFKLPSALVDDLPTLLAEPDVSADEDSIYDTATNERLPANFFDSVDEVSPTIMTEVGESAEDSMDAFVREVNEVLEDEREPLEALDSSESRNEPTVESDEELTDALAWLEELVTGTDVPLDEMTIELNETDVNRLLDTYRPSEFEQPVQDISDHPTLITQHPGITHDVFDEPGDDLDEALSWLEGLDFDEESSLLEPPPISSVEAPITQIDYSAARNSARHAFETRAYPEAIILLEDLLQREDTNATAIVIEDLVEWTGKVQDHPPLYRLLGDAYLQRGDYEKAAWTFRRGLTV